MFTLLFESLELLLLLLQADTIAIVGNNGVLIYIIFMFLSFSYDLGKELVKLLKLLFLVKQCSILKDQAYIGWRILGIVKSNYKFNILFPILQQLHVNEFWLHLKELASI